MKIVQMTMDEELIIAVDKAASRLGTSRSDFTRKALREALQQIQIREMENKQREGYKRQPVRHGEFSAWEVEQVWGDE